MNDTLANITKTLLGNADEGMEFFFLLLLGFLPKRSYQCPAPTLMHKDGKQKNFQESENLIYLKEKKNPGCVSLRLSFSLQKEGWILKTFKPELKYLFLNQMRINESENLNKYIICWPSLLDEAVYPDLIYLAIHSSAVKWDKPSPFTLFTVLSQLLLALPWLRVCQHFHYKSLFAAAEIHSQLLHGVADPHPGAQPPKRWMSFHFIIHSLCYWGTQRNVNAPHIHEACSHLPKKPGTSLFILYFGSSFTDLRHFQNIPFLFPFILKCESICISQDPSLCSAGLHPQGSEGLGS